jgi:Flp pilus assembly pilin Flp
MKVQPMKKLKELFANTDGASIVEYALLCALIAVAGLSSLNQISENLNGSFDRLTQAID